MNTSGCPAEPGCRDRDGGPHVDAQREGLAGSLASCDLARIAAPEETGIERRAIGIDRPAGGRSLDLGAGGKAGIEQAHLLEPPGGCAVGRHAPGLEYDRLLPGNAEPGEVGEDAGDELWATAAYVDVLDAHEEPTAQHLRTLIADQRRESVTQMHLAVRARGETEDAGHGAR